MSAVFALCVSTAQAQSLSAEFAAAARSTPLFTANQIVDRPPVATPGRSLWGVVVGVTPQWWLPDVWKEAVFDDATTLEGRELRIGFRRGKPLGYEFGLSFVRKSMTRFLIEGEGRGDIVLGDGTVLSSRDTYTPLETVHVPGLEYYSFVPIGKIGGRVQLGTLLSFGAGLTPDTLVRERVEGPPFYATANDFFPLATLPANGGFVINGRGDRLPVPPGQTTAEGTEIFREIWTSENITLLIRAQIAADVLIAPPFKVRFSGGFNYPGAERFGIEAVYMFGGGR